MHDTEAASIAMIRPQDVSSSQEIFSTSSFTNARIHLCSPHEVLDETPLRQIFNSFHA